LAIFGPSLSAFCTFYFLFFTLHFFLESTMFKCTVCHHPERQAIDCALLTDNDTYAALSQQYGPSISALFRHKKHLQEKIRQTEKRLENSLRQETLFRYNDFLESTRQIVRTASADGDTRQVLRAVREGTRILNFITKLEVQFDPDTVYRLLASPQWVSQDSLLPTDPSIITGTHQTLADDLFSPCPDPEPEIIPAATHSYLLGTRNSELENPATPPLETPNPAPAPMPKTLPPGITQEQLQQILTRLDHRPVTPPATENPPKNQREISAKLTRKIFPLPINYEEYQKDKQCKKNAAKNPGRGRESTRRAAYAQAPPAAQMENIAPPAVNCPQPLEPSTPFPKTACQQLETPRPPVPPDPFLQAFPYLVLQTRSP
jgi:hypothetical protein